MPTDYRLGEYQFSLELSMRRIEGH